MFRNSKVSISKPKLASTSNKICRLSGGVTGGMELWGVWSYGGYGVTGGTELRGVWSYGGYGVTGPTFYVRNCMIVRY